MMPRVDVGPSALVQVARISHRDRSPKRCNHTKTTPTKRGVPMISARDVHSKFCDSPGSEYIASEEAIDGLIRLLTRLRPTRILEIGSGIGTLSFAIIATMEVVRPAEYQFVMVETDDYCRSRLAANLGDLSNRATLLRSAGESSLREFDMMVIDGWDRSDDEYLRMLAARGVVFLEGDREPQRCAIERSRPDYARTLYRSMRTHRAAAHHRRRHDGAAPTWGGAYWVYQFEPTVLETASYRLADLWNGALVDKRRRLKLLREAVASALRNAHPGSLADPLRGESEGDT